MWKSYCQPKHRVFFFWLLMNDRLSTRNILQIKHIILDSYNCEFCLTPFEETAQHLSWECPFAQQCWGIINLEIVQNGNTFQNIQALKDQLQSQFFMIAIVLMSWTIWKARNEAIFNNNQLSILECRRSFFIELTLVSLRVKSSLTQSFDQWKESLQ